MKKCKRCGKEHNRESKYCNYDCLRREKYSERYKICEICKTEYYKEPSKQTKKNVCSLKCLGKYNHDEAIAKNSDNIIKLLKNYYPIKHIQQELNVSNKIIREVCKINGIDYDSFRIYKNEKEKKELKKEKDEKERFYVSKALKIKRNGGSLSYCLKKISSGEYEDCYIHTLINKHCKYYKKLSKKRRNKSKYVFYEKNKKARSLIYRKESIFRDYIAQIYKGEIEVATCGGKRCDVVAMISGEKYAIECKITSNSKDIETAVGQSLYSAYILNAKPAIAIPSDIKIESTYIEFLRKIDVKIFRDNRELPLLEVKEKPKYNPNHFWDNGMKKTWLEIRKTKKANPETMKVLGFTDQQIKSCLGVKI